MQLPLSHACWGRLRTLTMSKREYGGQLVAVAQPGGGCAIETQTRLIKGTGLSAEDPDVDNYLNGNEKQDGVVVEVASTPFYREIFDISNVCLLNKRCNIYFHTHMGPLSPPSVGDFAAHAVFGNLRQAAETPGLGLLNTMLVCGVEGCYEYNLLPTKLEEMRRLVAAIEREHPKTVAKHRGQHPKELAPEVVDAVRKHVFDELLEANGKYERDEVEAFMSSRERLFSMSGAPAFEGTLWSCEASDCHPNYPFPYAEALATNPKFAAEVEAFINDNAYIRALKANGYYYRFHPWPRGDDELRFFVNTVPGRAAAATTQRRRRATRKRRP